ncbi:hypothetical protein CMI46_02275 [Candidatus Pacearchaeota archaeon]|nr:hypothetical protein [Candidatus Pacearchaeota archaeon]|tara:strand:+ start:15877 stop:16167 length:291 start_codon:yes stop_codon:yes gene_type:complete
MSDYIFEVTDKTGRRIHLSSERWNGHIRIEHPNVEEDEIKLTLQKPMKIIDKGKNKYFYYQYFKHKKLSSKLLCVIVKYLNGDGFVISAYFVRHIS